MSDELFTVAAVIVVIWLSGGWVAVLFTVGYALLLNAFEPRR